MNTHALTIATIALLAIGLAGPLAGAADIEDQIVVDPGTVGGQPTIPATPFDAVDDQLILSESVLLDFVFADMKHLEVVNIDDLEFVVTIDLDDPYNGLRNQSFSASLLDMDGSPILAAYSATIGGPTNQLVYTADFDPTVGTIFHGVRFAFTLPDDADVITASPDAGTFSQSFGAVALEVGEPTAVPEPASAALLAVGAVALLRRRRIA